MAAAAAPDRDEAQDICATEISDITPLLTRPTIGNGVSDWIRVWAGTIRSSDSGAHDEGAERLSRSAERLRPSVGCHRRLPPGRTPTMWRGERVTAGGGAWRRGRFAFPQSFPGRSVALMTPKTRTSARRMSRTKIASSGLKQLMAKVADAMASMTNEIAGWVENEADSSGEVGEDVAGRR